ncbi:MAG: elongation factor G [Desulfitibacter sp. BRH_c19]|nr:MAG: elongation factor G [Desulfitibacter sp. BRH_c19]
MKVYSANKIRNIGIMAHGGAGKTSLAEAMLYNSGAVKRLGKVDEGNTTTDYLPEEIERKVTITLALAPCEWKNTKVNLIDTPGFIDFVGDVNSALRVIDSMIVTVCAVAGVEVRTEAVWEFANERNMPRICFINKMDRENADFYRVLDELKDSFENRIVPLQLPIGSAESFSGIVDLVTMKAYKYDDGKPIEIDIPEDLKEQAETYREELVEVVAESDDELLMKYLEGEDLTPEEFAAALNSGVKNAQFIPVACGSTLNNMGITNLLDYTVECMPSAEEALNKSEEELAKEPFKAIVFKTIADPYVGKVSYFRIYSGVFIPGNSYHNINKETDEKVNSVFVMRGKQQEQVEKMMPGDIGALTKLAKTETSDTLSVKGINEPLDGIEFPNPTLSYAISPKSKGDEDKLGNAISRILEEDKTLTLEKNIETKETILSGMGDQHLDIVIERLQNKYGVGVEKDTPSVPYRETIRSAVTKIEGKHKKQSGGAGQFGHVYIDMAPHRDDDFLFEQTIFGGSVPRNYIPAVEKGVQEAMQQGVLAKYPVSNIKVTLTDGSYHPVDSNEMAFKIAGSLAFKKAMEKADPILLEPIMKVEVTVPEQFMGDIMGDMNSKRGRILGMEAKGKSQVIKALAPLSEMYRYAIDLKSISQGRGTFTMEFNNYDPVPDHLAEKVIAARKTAEE